MVFDFGFRYLVSLLKKNPGVFVRSNGWEGGRGQERENQTEWDFEHCRRAFYILGPLISEEK